MADVKNVVTLGIGAAPGGLVWFFTGGLEAAAEVVAPPVYIAVPYQNRTMAVSNQYRTMVVPLENRTMAVPRKRGTAP